MASKRVLIEELKGKENEAVKNRFVFYMIEDKMKKMKNCYLQL